MHEKETTVFTAIFIELQILAEKKSDKIII